MTPIDDHDRQVIDALLKGLHINTVLSENTNQVSITPVAVHLLQCVYHFLRWKSNILRTSEEISEMILPYYSIIDITHSDDPNIPQILSSMLLTSITNSISRYSSIIHGLDMVMYVLRQVLTARAFQYFLHSLNWTVVKGQYKFQLDVFTVDMQETPLPMIYGFLVAMTMYPQIQQQYSVQLDEIPLYPLYDNEVQITNINNKTSNNYRILVPGLQFTGHYVDEIKKHNAAYTGLNQTRTVQPRMVQNHSGLVLRHSQYGNKVFLKHTPVALPLQLGYLYFQSPEFLQGLLTLTNIFEVQPWISLEIYEKEVWVPAKIELPDTSNNTSARLANHEPQAS